MQVNRQNFYEIYNQQINAINKKNGIPEATIPPEVDSFSLDEMDFARMYGTSDSYNSTGKMSNSGNFSVSVRT